jgi:hypothetical protein
MILITVKMSHFREDLLILIYIYILFIISNIFKFLILLGNILKRVDENFIGIRFFYSLYLEYFFTFVCDRVNLYVLHFKAKIEVDHLTEYNVIYESKFLLILKSIYTILFLHYNNSKFKTNV